MRPIKFRGQRVDNREWVYGDLAHTYKGETVIQNWRKSAAYKNGELDHHIVIPETVGQFTGLTDKNVREIYEGDVLKDGKGGDGEVEYRAPQFVVWADETHFALAEGKINMKQLQYSEVIGNIHEPISETDADLDPEPMGEGGRK